jgi:parallel beta-helix repeat protein
MKTRGLNLQWSAITKITFLISFILLLKFQSYSQEILINEDFTEYQLTDICSNENWSSTTNPPIINIENTIPITFHGYNSFGGRYIKYKREGKNINSLIHRKFSTNIIAKSGDILYFSFILRFNKNPKLGNNHFISLRNSYKDSKFHFLRICAKSKGKGFQIGIGKGGILNKKTEIGQITWANKLLNLNETYLIVVKYIVRDDNDEIYLWLNPDLSGTLHEDNAYLKKTGPGDRLFIGDTIEGIDLSYLEIYSPAPAIDGIKLTRGTISQSEKSWKTFKNIAQNTPPQIIKNIKDISVLENSQNTIISLRDYFIDTEDDTSDLKYTIITTDPEHYSTAIDDLSDRLIINYKETGTISKSKITIRATDSGGMHKDLSFYITVKASKITFSVLGTEITQETDTLLKTFTIIKKGTTNLNSQINYSITGTAQKDKDYKIIYTPWGYMEKSGTINFAPDEYSKTINLKLINDKFVENIETIKFNLSNPKEDNNTEIITSSAIKTIKDNDFAPTIKPNQSFSIVEKSKKNTVIGTLEISSKMSGTKLQDWTIVKNSNQDGDANTAFLINPNSGEIIIDDAGDINYDVNHKLKIQVKVSDGYNFSSPEDIIINIEKTEDNNPSNIIFVKTTGNDKNSGYSWNNALKTIQAAIDQAHIYKNYEIWVAKGTYFPTLLYDRKTPTISKNIRKKSLIIKNNIKLYGGFSGIENNISQRERKDINKDGYISPWELVNKSIISGDIGISHNNIDNCYHIIYCNTIKDTTAKIDGFIIKDGNANGTNPNNESGGGIYCGKYCNLNVFNCIITNNSASKNGGGIFCHNNKTKIQTNYIYNNYSLNGAGIYCYNECKVSITKNHIIDNIAKEYGGGIFCTDNSQPLIINNIISGNSAFKSGGGIVCNNTSNAYITNNTITKNSAKLFGGGIFCNFGSTPYIINTILWGNKQNNKPNQFNSSGSGYPQISHSAIQGGFSDYKDYIKNNNINLNEKNNSVNGPKFYNTTENKEDWRIQLNSICKERGNMDTSNLNLPITDISGYKRIHGYIDIGAYEFPLNNWPSTKKNISYGQKTSEAGIDTSEIKTSVRGTFMYKNPNKKLNVGEKQIDTIIFSPVKFKDLYKIKCPILVNVKKALLTIIADNKSKRYKEENPLLTYKFYGFQNNEDSCVIDTPPIIETKANKNSPTGNYPITFREGFDNNYNFKYINGNLVITKQFPIISQWPIISNNITYGQTISEAKINNTQSNSSIPGTFSFKEPTKFLNAGNKQKIILLFTPDDKINYSNVEKTFNIDVYKAILTLSTDNKTIYFGKPKPEFHINYSGFKNNDDENIFTNKPIASVWGNWPLGIGKHDILIDLCNTKSVNYKIIAQNGILTIVNNPPSLVDKIPNIKVLENAKDTYIDVSNYFNDIEQKSSELIYSIRSKIPDHFNCFINPKNQLIIDYKKTGTKGPEIIVIRATDKHNDYAEQSFTVEVNPGKVNFSVTGNEIFEEGNTGTFRKYFTINKEGNTNQICSIEYEIKGNADPNSDYLITGNTSNTGKLIFKPDNFSKNINIDIKKDKYAEQDEEIQLLIKNSYSEGNSIANISNFIATKTILNDDHSPEIYKDQIFYLDENSPLGSIVCKIEGTDVDNLNSLQNWEITEGNTNNAFRINSTTGQLIVNNSNILDKEKLDEINLFVKVGDGANSSKPEEIVIKLNDINDVAPIIKANQSFEIKEGTTNGSIISTIIFHDGDITPSSNNTWNIIENFDSDNDNIPAIKINPPDGTIMVNDSDEFDYEKIKSFKIAITVNDGVNTSLEEFITIKIKNIQEANEFSQINIFPNPAKTFTIINSKEKGKLLIYNDSGKLLINKILLKGDNSIPLTNMSPGVYYFVIKLKSRTIEKTIVTE